MIVSFFSGVQPHGMTPPVLSAYWKAWTRRMASSTERPTGRSLIVTWRTTPLSETMNIPRSAMPASSTRTPKSRAILWFVSAKRSHLHVPMPPSFWPWRHQA
eukprot:XP_001710117.1 Hypothetical protein GL50803_31706 [Giardia lamblia ATCC 50803]